MKQNFDRFISCKTTIDDIYVKLQRIEGAGTGISTAVLFNAVSDVQGSAKRAFGPLLERHAKAERIKSVQVRSPGRAASKAMAAGSKPRSPQSLTGLARLCPGSGTDTPPPRAPPRRRCCAASSRCSACPRACARSQRRATMSR